jgi:hypothetical protein
MYSSYSASSILSATLAASSPARTVVDVPQDLSGVAGTVKSMSGLTFTKARFMSLQTSSGAGSSSPMLYS